MVETCSWCHEPLPPLWEGASEIDHYAASPELVRLERVL